MKDAPVIILSGYAGSGKSTISKYLVDNFGFIELSFADELKNSASDTYGIDRRHFDDPAHKNKGIRSLEADPHDPLTHVMECIDGRYYWTPRAIAILEGNTRRRVQPLYWISALLVQLNLARVHRRPVVISDCRFPNELEALKKFPNSHHVRINRWDSAEFKDKSETSLDNAPVDQYLTNHKNLTALFDQVNLLLHIIS